MEKQNTKEINSTGPIALIIEPSRELAGEWVGGWGREREQKKDPIFFFFLFFFLSFHFLLSFFCFSLSSFFLLEQTHEAICSFKKHLVSPSLTAALFVFVFFFFVLFLFKIANSYDYYYFF